MTQEEFDAYLVSLGLIVETIADPQGLEYTVVRDFEIPTGPLHGKHCDVALARSTATPYAVASAIQTSPPLVAMGTATTQASPLAGWQYWSRRYDHVVTPQRIWAHVLTILGDQSLVAA
jgi:hypothetical protein